MSPRLSIKVESIEGYALSNFPIKIALDEGLRVASGPTPVGQKLVKLSNTKLQVVTDSNGCATIPFNFNEKQPNPILILLGKNPLPNRDIEITPLKNLPKGSKITISVPNP